MAPCAEDFVPEPRDGIIEVDVGDQIVLVDGWSVATVLNLTGAAMWHRIDGTSTIGEIAADLAATAGVDPTIVKRDLAAFVEELGAAGLITNTEPADDTGVIKLVPTPQPGTGDEIDDLSVVDHDGQLHTLSDLLTDTMLLVNWNPHCGFCASIVRSLVSLEEPLERAGVKMVFVAFGDADSNRELVREVGLRSPVLLLGDNDSPFGDAGTPAAFQLDRHRRIAADPAYGNLEVPALARRLAGIDADGTEGGVRAGVRYLLEADGICAPGLGTGDRLSSSDTIVIDVEGYHVGIRVDSPATAHALRRLFRCGPIDDPHAGHSYSLALPGLTRPEMQPGRGLNILAQPTGPTVRTRDPARALRALLSDLDDRISTAAGQGPAGGQMRTLAIPVGVGHGVGLVPLVCHDFAPRLQPLLAARGVTLGDAPHPEIDLTTGDVVIPEPTVDYDPEVLADLAVDLVGVRGELPALLPGRYPLRGWCTLVPGEQVFTEFTAAEAAAVTVSFCLDTDSPAERVRQLGELFATVPAYGLWYNSDTQLADLIASALVAG